LPSLAIPIDGYILKVQAMSVNSCAYAHLE
jgi:hypothetical protein